MLNVAVLVSGGGTNLQAILDSEAKGQNPHGKVKLVVSSKQGVYALERAEKAGVATAVICRKDCTSQQEFDKKLLAGFLSILGEEVIKAYPNRILNVHPSLIPSFCGAGFYGLKVHQAALEKGVKVTGATVHFVNEICDGGAIIAQKAVDVLEGDTPETLQKRVMEQAEWELLPAALAKVCKELDV